jgi:hypothetical protein
MAKKKLKKKLKPSEIGVQKVTVRIPEGEWRLLKKSLQADGKTVTGYFRKMIREFLQIQADIKTLKKQ